MLSVLFYITVIGNTAKIRVLIIKCYIYIEFQYFFFHFCSLLHPSFLLLFFLPLIPKANSLAESLFEALSAGYHMGARWWGVWDLVRRLILIVILVVLPGRTVSITWKRYLYIFFILLFDSHSLMLRYTSIFVMLLVFYHLSAGCWHLCSYFCTWPPSFCPPLCYVVA